MPTHKGSNYNYRDNTLTYEERNEELMFKGEDVVFDVYARANYYYQPMVMYFKDGSGQPEDEEFDIDEIQITNARWKESGKPLTEEEVAEFEDEVNDYLSEKDYDEWEGWYEDEEDYYPDPPEEGGRYGWDPADEAFSSKINNVGKKMKIKSVKFVKSSPSRFTPEQVKQELEHFNIENPEDFMGIDFNINKKDISSFAKSWAYSTNKDAKSIASVQYDPNKYEIVDGAYIVTYKDGSVETWGWNYGGYTLKYMNTDHNRKPVTSAKSEEEFEETVIKSAKFVKSGKKSPIDFSDSKWLFKIAKKVGIPADKKGWNWYYKDKSNWFFTLSTEDEYDANKVRDAIGDVLDGTENAYGASYDDIPGMGDIHLGCVPFYEWEEMTGGDTYEDLREDIRDKYVVFAVPGKDWKSYRQMTDW